MTPDAPTTARDSGESKATPRKGGVPAETPEEPAT